MTTTISLPTRDCIVIGCDSLATSSRTVVDPIRIWNAFFDEDGNIRMDEDKNPLLSSAKKLFAYGEDLPNNQYPNVTKIFSLKPYRAGLLFAGIAGIGHKSIRSLVETFLDKQRGTPVDPKTKPLKELGESLLKFLDSEFESCFAEMEKDYRPEMEIILSGYSDDSRIPEIFKLTLGPQTLIESVSTEGQYDIVFGGQYDVIQRVVKGISTSEAFAT